MTWYIIKIFLTAAIIVAVSEIGKFNTFLGSLLASIPLVSTLGMIWMYQEKTPISKITIHSVGVFWMVLPSLPMFLLMPWLLEKQGWSFYQSLIVSLILTAVLYLITSFLLKKYGVFI